MKPAFGPLESAKQPPGSAAFRLAMDKIRKRRLLLWGVILVYMPSMWAALQLSQSYHATALAFIAWVLLLFVVAIYAAVARCPGCGNYFHMNGMTLLFLRKCLHCGLHVTADKRQSQLSKDNAEDGSTGTP